MILAKEITVWSTDFQPNHTYLMNDSMDKIIGYFKWNNPKDFTKFKNPLDSILVIANSKSSSVMKTKQMPSDGRLMAVKTMCIM